MCGHISEFFNELQAAVTKNCYKKVSFFPRLSFTESTYLLKRRTSQPAATIIQKTIPEKEMFLSAAICCFAPVHCTVNKSVICSKRKIYIYMFLHFKARVTHGSRRKYIRARKQIRSEVISPEHVARLCGKSLKFNISR